MLYKELAEFLYLVQSIVAKNVAPREKIVTTCLSGTTLTKYSKKGFYTPLLIPLAIAHSCYEEERQIY